MANSTLPTADRELDDFAANVVAEVSEAPEDYGTNAARVAQCGTKRVAFDVNLTATINPATRTPVAIVAKSNSRAALLADLRELIRIIEACPTVTDEMRRSLGINIRKAPAPIPAPAEAPELDILSVNGRTVRCRVHGLAANKRGKPAGVAGVAFYSFVGPEAPAEPGQWKLEGSSTRTTFDVSFPQGQPGDKVWLTACWYNPRLQQGPTCPASSTNLQFGSARAAA